MRPRGKSQTTQWLIALGMLGISTQFVCCSQRPSDQCTEVTRNLPHDSRPPRANLNPNLNLLSLRLSKGLYADDRIYDRLARDVAIIRALDRGLESVQYRPRLDPHSVNVFFSPETLTSARKGRYRAWDCLNGVFGAQIEDYSKAGFMLLHLPGLYNPDKVVELYRRLPGVTRVVVDGVIGDGSNIYVTRNDSAWIYIFDIAGGDCPSGCLEHQLHYFEITADGTVAQSDAWDSKLHRDAPPEWATDNFRKYR